MSPPSPVPSARMGALQEQGEPTGSREVRKAQLLHSLEDRTTRDLRLTSYNTAKDIFCVLENRFGNRTAIAIEIVEELQRIPPVRGHQPRKIVELIQAVGKALQDLSDLGTVETLKKEWLVFVADKRNAVEPETPLTISWPFTKSRRVYTNSWIN